MPDLVIAIVWFLVLEKKFKIRAFGYCSEGCLSHGMKSWSRVYKVRLLHQHWARLPRVDVGLALTPVQVTLHSCSQAERCLGWLSPWWERYPLLVTSSKLCHLNTSPNLRDESENWLSWCLKWCLCQWVLISTFLDATEWRIALLLQLVAAPEPWDSANSSSELCVIQEPSSRMPSIKASLLRLANDQAVREAGWCWVGGIREES